MLTVKSRMLPSPVCIFVIVYVPIQWPAQCSPTALPIHFQDYFLICLLVPPIAYIGLQVICTSDHTIPMKTDRESKVGIL